MVALAPLAEAPPGIIGRLNFREETVPVLDLRIRLGEPTAPSELTTPIVVVAAAGARLGLVADAVTEVLAIADGRGLDGFRDPSRAQLFDSVVQIGHRLIPRFALDRLAAGRSV